MSETSQDLAPFRKNRPHPPLEDYVQRELAVTLMDLGRVKTPTGEHVKDKDDEAVLARSEKYARWRWHGFVNGEIASL